MQRPLFIFAALTAGLITTQAFAQNAGQQACGNDVFALCQQAIPDHGRIAACLTRNFRQVSAPCREFMASYANATPETGRTHVRHHVWHHHHYAVRHHRRHHSRS